MTDERGRHDQPDRDQSDRDHRAAHHPQQARALFDVVAAGRPSERNSSRSVVEVRPPEPLTAEAHARLVAIIEETAPELLPLARDAVNTRWLTIDECEALTGALLGVFLDSLNGDDEPTREGADADDLLGRVQMQREDYWTT